MERKSALKRTPRMKKLEEILKASKIVAGGFLGRDTRIVEEILEADAAELAGLGTTEEEVAARMREMTEVGRKGLGTWIRYDPVREVMADDNRGQLVCPWPHAGRYGKTVTTLRRTDTHETLRWSDLSIHFIEAHGFFQGKGSAFRLEPGTLVRLIFG